MVRGAGRNRPKGARASRLRAFKQESAPRQGTSVEYRSVILRRGKTGHASLIVLLKHETKRDWNIALRSGECFNPDEKHTMVIDSKRGGEGGYGTHKVAGGVSAPPPNAPLVEAKKNAKMRAVKPAAGCLARSSGRISSSPHQHTSDAHTKPPVRV